MLQRVLYLCDSVDMIMATGIAMIFSIAIAVWTSLVAIKRIIRISIDIKSLTHSRKTSTAKYSIIHGIHHLVISIHL